MVAVQSTLMAQRVQELYDLLLSRFPEAHFETWNDAPDEHVFLVYSGADSSTVYDLVEDRVTEIMLQDGLSIVPVPLSLDDEDDED